MFPLFDAHCDTAYAIFPGKGLRKNDLHTDLERRKAFSVTGQVYALWQYAADRDNDQVQSEFWAMLNNFLAECEKNADLVKVCESFGDLNSAFRKNRQAALLSVEGAGLFGCSIENLERVREKGVRIVHLCWNSDNALTGAVMDSGSGLTRKGRDFVLECAKLGIMIDLSHISDAAAWDVIGMDCVSVLAGHSNSRSVCNVPRNLPDDLLAAIAQNGGVVGLNLCPVFLGGTDPSHAKRHTEHMIRVCGSKNVCLGCDLDGVDELPEGIKGIEDMPALRAALGFSENELDDIFFNNLMSFWERTL